MTAAGGLQPAQGNGPSAPGAGGSSGSSSPSESPGSNAALSPPSGSGQMQAGNVGAPASNGAAPASNGAAGSSAVPAPSAGAGGASMTDPPAMLPPVAPPPTAMPTPMVPPPAMPAPPVTTPPSDTNCPGLFFCDGFEDVAAGSSPNADLWQVIDAYAPRDTSANVQVSAAMARSGGQALRVLGSGSRNGIVASLPEQSYFIRAWLRLDSVPQGPVLIGVGADQNNEVRLRLWSPSLATVNVSQGDAVRPNGATSGNCPTCVTLVPDTWFCAEMQIDNATRSARLWIDGVEAANLPNGDGGVPAQPASPVVFLGSMGLQGGTTGVWIDDVAAGSERVGCN